MTPDRHDDQRVVRERARFLEATTRLDTAESRTLAWREAGYSHSGIAKKVGSTEATVAERLDRITARYGIEAVLSKQPDERGRTPLSPATPEEIVNDLLDEDDWRAKKAAFDVHLDFLAFLGFDEVLANTDEEDGPRTGASTSRPGKPGEHRLPKETRDAIGDMMERTEEQLEPFRVEQGDADGGGE